MVFYETLQTNFKSELKMDLTHSTDLTTIPSESYIPGSKSTDFIKPKGSSNNLEAQNQGEKQFSHHFKCSWQLFQFELSKQHTNIQISLSWVNYLKFNIFCFLFCCACILSDNRWISSVHKTMDSFSNLYTLFCIKCSTMDSVQHHCKCRRKVSF